MLKRFLYWVVGLITSFHSQFLELNNRYNLSLTDKQLHFLIIGVLGMAVFLMVHPVFRYLARRGHVITISWIYTITVVIVLTFAIEIGQKITGTGSMEFADIVFGIVGFLVIFGIFVLIRGLFLWIRRQISKKTA